MKVLILTDPKGEVRQMDVVGLYQHDLDDRQSAALRAAYLIRQVTSEFLTWLDILERATLQLGRSAETSTRAVSAHTHFVKAQDLSNRLVAHLSDAQDALAFHWPTSV